MQRLWEEGGRFRAAAPRHEGARAPHCPALPLIRSSLPHSVHLLFRSSLLHEGRDFVLLTCNRVDRSRHSDSNPFRQPASAPVISEAARPGAGTHLSADASRPLAGLRRLARRADGRSWIPVPQHQGPAAWFWSSRPPAPHEAPRASPRLPAGSPSARSSPAH